MGAQGGVVYTLFRCTWVCICWFRFLFAMRVAAQFQLERRVIGERGERFYLTGLLSAC